MKLQSEIQVKRASLPWQDMQGSVILLNPSRKRAHELNETASWIWKQLENPVEIGKIAQLFCDEFEVGEQEFQEDLITFLSSLEAEGLIEWQS